MKNKYYIDNTKSFNEYGPRVSEILKSLNNSKRLVNENKYTLFLIKRNNYRYKLLKCFSKISLFIVLAFPSGKTCISIFMLQSLT